MLASHHPICLQCGVEYERGSRDPAHCPVCSDERQFVRWDGQAWTSLDELAHGHTNRFEAEGEGLVGIGTEPRFAIGQRALLVKSSAGNILWDCLTLLDDATVEFIRSQGGLQAIALSHPHFYGTMVTWSETFADAPIYIHRADAQWVPRQGNIVLWEGESLALSDDVTLINAGIHFAGGTMLHWAQGAGGAGALLSGDILQVVMDRRHVSFMYSYPNLIPERPSTIKQALRRTDAFAFDHIYGAWWSRNIVGGGKQALNDSARRYLARVS